MAQVEFDCSARSDWFGAKHQAAEISSVQLWSETERQQQLLQYKAPDFNFHYPLRISIFADKGRQDIFNWLVEHGMDKLFTQEVYSKFLEADMPRLASRVFVDQGKRGHDWGCKFTSWLFVLDDQMDDTALGMKRGFVVPLFLELHKVLLWNFPEDADLKWNVMKFLDEFANPELTLNIQEFIRTALERERNGRVDTAYDGELGPIASGLRDMWASCLTTMPEKVNLRIAQSIQRYFLGNLYEVKNREDNIIPSLADYIAIRRKSGAVEPSMLVADLFEEDYMPDELFNSRPMKQMMTAIIDIVCWHNDVWSFKKERSKGDVHNLVAVIAYNRKNCSYRKASLIARAMIYDSLANLEKAATELLAITPPACVNSANRYIRLCRNWIQGTQSWHSTSCRYQLSSCK